MITPSVDKRRLPSLVAGSVIALAFILLLTGTALMIVETSISVGHFTDVDYPDSAMVLRIRDLLRLGRLYPALDRPPYMLSAYGPLAYVLLAVPYRLAELADANPVVAVRLALLGCLCVCLCALYLIGRRLHGSRWTATLCVLFAAASTPLTVWTVQIRGDLPALALSLASIYLVADPKGRWRSVGAICCAGAAPLIKQTFLAAPVAIILWHLYNRRHREAALWIAGVGVVTGGGFAVAWLREPEMLMHLEVMRGPILDYWTGEWPETGLGLIWTAVSQPIMPFFALGCFLSMQHSPGLKRLILFFCTAAWLIAVFIAAHVGSGFNVFWEPLFASALIAGPGLTELMRRDGRIPAAVSGLLLSLLLAMCFDHVGTDMRRILKESPSRLASRSSEKARWESFVSVVSGRRLLSTLPSVTILSSSPEVPDPIANSEMEMAGSWSSAPVVAAIHAGAYELIVISGGEADPARTSPAFRGTTRWNDRMWSALRAKYQLAFVCGDMEVWLPPNRTRDILLRLASAGCVRTGE